MLCRYTLMSLLSLLLIICIFPLIAQAQIGDNPFFLEQDDVTGDYYYSPTDYQINLIGILSLDNRFRDNLIFYKLGFSILYDYFHLEVLWDREQEEEGLGNLFRNWTSTRQLASKITNLSYGIYNETPIYAHYGEIYDFNAGMGTIIKNYTNDIQSPVIQGTGLHLAIDFDFIKAEGISADLISPDLYAGYVSVKPLFFFDSLEFYKEFEIGYAYAIDRQPYRITYYDNRNEPEVNEPFITEDYDIQPVIIEDYEIYLKGNTPNISSISGWSIYARIPIYELDFISFMVMVEYASEYGLGTAFRYGINGEIFNKVIDYRLEFIHYERGFIPSIFNTQYDNRKVNRYIYALHYKNSNYGTPFGYYFELGKDIIPNRLGFIFSFEDYFDDFKEVTTTNNEGQEEVKDVYIGGEVLIRFYLKEIVKGMGLEILINKWDVRYDTPDSIEPGLEGFFYDTIDKTMWYAKFYWWLTPNARFSVYASKYFLMRDDFIMRQHTFGLETMIYI